MLRGDNIDVFCLLNTAYIQRYSKVFKRCSMVCLRKIMKYLHFKYLYCRNHNSIIYIVRLVLRTVSSFSVHLFILTAWCGDFAGEDVLAISIKFSENEFMFPCVLGIFYLIAEFFCTEEEKKKSLRSIFAQQFNWPVPARTFFPHWWASLFSLDSIPNFWLLKWATWLDRKWG